jgi:hypothetical protein
MTEGTPAAALELEDVLRRLEDSRQRLMDSLAGCNTEQFDGEAGDGESIKRTLERTVDDLNFYYGRLVARAMSLPQPPCMQTADFVSQREAVMSLQVAHRRFSNLLHDLIPADLDREAVDAEHGSYTMRQLLEMSAAHYDVRTQQVNRIAAEIPRSS